jgi:hypothetical protein
VALVGGLDGLKDSDPLYKWLTILACQSQTSKKRSQGKGFLNPERTVYFSIGQVSSWTLQKGVSYHNAVYWQWTEVHIMRLLFSIRETVSLSTGPRKRWKVEAIPLDFPSTGNLAEDQFSLRIFKSYLPQVRSFASSSSMLEA